MEYRLVSQLYIHISLAGKINAKRARRHQQNRREGIALDKTSDQTNIKDLVHAFNIPDTGNNCKSREKNRLKCLSSSGNKEGSQLCCVSEEVVYNLIKML